MEFLWDLECREVLSFPGEDLNGALVDKCKRDYLFVVAELQLQVLTSGLLVFHVIFEVNLLLFNELTAFTDPP